VTKKSRRFYFHADLDVLIMRPIY